MKKILLFIGTILILFLLINISFFSKNSKVFEGKIDFEIKQGNYSFDINDNKISFDEFSDNENTNIHFINPFDKVLYSGDFDVKTVDGKNEITLGKGVYLINISELNSSTKIISKGFEINHDGPLNLFIDTNSKNYTVFSENAITELKLTDIESLNVLNTLYLYPHMYVKFLPEQNSNIKNADILKITQWFPIDYLVES